LNFRSKADFLSSAVRSLYFVFTIIYFPVEFSLLIFKLRDSFFYLF